MERRKKTNPTMLSRGNFTFYFTIVAWFAGAVLLTASIAQAQNLFVTDYSPYPGDNGNITEIIPAGTKNPFNDELNQPSGVAMDRAGNLFVSDINGGYDGGGIIYEFTNGVASGRSTFASGLSYPGALAFDSAGNLYEADLNSGYIYKFTNCVASEQGIFASVQRPFGLAFNSAGDLFVGDLNIGSSSPLGAITEITPGGTQSTFATNLWDPEALAFDSAGDLFVSDYEQSTIFEYTNGVATERGVFASGLNVPVGLAFDNAGNLYEADYGSGDIYEFTNCVASEQGVFATGLPYPDFLAFVPNTNTTFSVSVKMFAGIILNNGQIGSNYLIQATSNLSSSNWITLTNVTLPSQPYIYIDYRSYTNSRQFYRVQPQ
jgi:hypothetical protein